MPIDMRVAEGFECYFRNGVLPSPFTVWILPISSLMKISRLLSAGALALLLAPSVLQAAEKSRVDPQALVPLRRMSDTLAAAKSFSFRSRSVIEVPATTGQFLTLFSHADVAVQRPDKIRARLRGEAPAFDFYFNGKTVSAFAPGTKAYSTLSAPATIDVMLPDLERETGIRFVTSPLFFSNPYRILTKGLTSAIVVGPATIRGDACQHLAFRSPGVNWEIWIESGPRALPRRLAVTFTDQPNFPRTLVEFADWNLNAWLKAGDFEFRKPADAKEIPFEAVWSSTGR